jgi:hypothetical protein
MPNAVVSAVRRPCRSTFFVTQRHVGARRDDQHSSDGKKCEWVHSVVSVSPLIVL